MEQRFVQHMQAREKAAREKAAASSSSSSSSVAAQRAAFAQQFDAHVQRVERDVDAGAVAAAQSALQQLRVLVQDTANSVALTAYDMARANSTLTRLQQRIAAAAAAASAGSGHATTAVRRFQFSSRPSTTTTTAATTTAATSSSDATATTTAATHVGSGGSDVATSSSQQQQQHTYSGIEDAVVYVDTAPAVFIKQCRRCRVLALPVAGSVFVDDCASCTLYVACHQLRLRNCHDMHVYVYCASTPVIEHCDDMSFGSYDAWHGLLSSTTADGRRFDSHEAWVRCVGDMHATAAQLRASCANVSDFHWLKKTPSPHWRRLQTHEVRVCDAPFVHTSSSAEQQQQQEQQQEQQEEQRQQQEEQQEL